MTPNAPTAGQLSAAKVRLPDHVVFRRFAAETVVLNITTGKYHGLNPTAGRMLELLSAAGSVPEAATQMAAEDGRPHARAAVRRRLGPRGRDPDGRRVRPARRGDRARHERLLRGAAGAWAH